MAYNSQLERSLEAAFKVFPAEIRDKISKKKMFGGLAFLYSGKMTVGIVGDDLMVRVISDKMETLLKLEYVRPMDFTNKPLKEFVYVSPRGYETEAELQDWIELGIEHARKVLGE